MLGPQCSPGPCGQQRARGTLNEALSSVLEGAPLGASGPASFPFIRHCENIPLCVYFLLSHLFVCLLIILLLEQNMQWIRRSGFCRKLRGLCHRAGWPSQAQEDGTWKELTEAPSICTGSGTVWRSRNTRVIKEGLPLWSFKRKHLRAKEGRGAPP